MRNHLNGLTQIITAPLFLDDRLVNAASGQIIFPAELRVCIALVMTQVEVCFGAIVGDVDLAVLVRAHGPRIDI